MTVTRRAMPEDIPLACKPGHHGQGLEWRAAQRVQRLERGSFGDRDENLDRVATPARAAKADAGVGGGT